jgi:hypothetical protein
VKKNLYIAFLFVYLISTIGIQVATHFCGDYPISVDLYAANTNAEPEDCCGDPCDDSCCTTDVKQIQITEDQQNVTKWAPAQLESITVIIPASLVEFIESTSISNYYLSFYSPPINDSNILNCTFRI